MLRYIDLGHWVCQVSVEVQSLGFGSLRAQASGVGGFASWAVNFKSACVCCYDGRQNRHCGCCEPAFIYACDWFLTVLRCYSNIMSVHFSLGVNVRSK